MKQMFCTQNHKTPTINISDWDKYYLHYCNKLNFFVDKLNDIMFKLPFFFSLVLNNLSHMGVCDVQIKKWKMFVHKPQPKKIHSVSGKVAFTIVEKGNVCIDSQFHIMS
jgi:hypothetical protein